MKKSSDNKRSYKKYINKRNIIVLSLIFIIAIFVLLLTRTSSVSYITIDSYADRLYEWQYEIEDNSIVEFVEKIRDNSNNKSSNGHVMEKYKFKALKKGKTIIKFTYINKNNKSFMDIYRYTVIVDKKLNLTIKKIEYNNKK